VVVTHNRRELLANCLAALRAQSRPPDSIFVVDNASTDDTAELLVREAREPGIPLHSLHSARNVGGAGGFAIGMKAAVRQETDWLWLMDDDSEPEADALRQLLSAAERVMSISEAPIGFLASRVLWRDGAHHAMNRTGRFSREPSPVALEGVVPADYASFVSLLLHRDAVLTCGLPIAEFFIGSDDVEYTWRLRRAGFTGHEVITSRVRHLTERNAGMSLWDLSVAPANVETWAIKIRNLIAVNRRRRWGWPRETLRVVLIAFNLRRRRIARPLRRRLVQAARRGLFWPYERLIRRIDDAVDI
jgi:glycosyltransferase involved in cell wall biosynthesis